MRNRLWLGVLVAFMALIMIPLALATNVDKQRAEATAAQQSREPVVNCSQVRISTQQVRITCNAAGIIVLNTVVSLPSVPPITLPPLPAVTLPGDRVTIRPPQATVTVGGPGATSTVTENVQGPSGTETIRRPGETVTETVTASPSAAPTTGQAGTEGDTIDSDSNDEDTVLTFPEIDLSVPEAAGIGFLALLAIASLIILGMWGGYYLGYKDSDKEEAKFLKALLRQ